MTEKDWYSNKELFESIGDLKDDLTETKHIIQKYNGLYEQTKQNNDDIKLVKDDIREVHIEVNKMKHEQSGKHKFINMVFQFSGWAVAIAGFLLTYFVGS